MKEDKSSGAPGNEKMKELLAEFNHDPFVPAKPDLIKISEEFHFNGKGLWLGLERTTNPAMDLSDQYVIAHEALVTAFKKITGQANGDVVKIFGETALYSEPPNVIDYKAKERLEKLIDDAATVEELKVYKDQVVQHGLVDMYADKMDFLQATSK